MVETGDTAGAFVMGQQMLPRYRRMRPGRDRGIVSCNIIIMEVGGGLAGAPGRRECKAAHAARALLPARPTHWGFFGNCLPPRFTCGSPAHPNACPPGPPARPYPPPHPQYCDRGTLRSAIKRAYFHRRLEMGLAVDMQRIMRVLLQVGGGGGVMCGCFCAEALRPRPPAQPSWRAPALALPTPSSRPFPTPWHQTPSLNPQVAMAVEHLHGRKLMHCDIKVGVRTTGVPLQIGILRRRQPPGTSLLGPCSLRAGRPALAPPLTLPQHPRPPTHDPSRLPHPHSHPTKSWRTCCSRRTPPTPSATCASSPTLGWSSS
jgi:hypothetical protein